MGIDLELFANVPIEPFGAGMQIARSEGRHVDRVLDFFDLIFVLEGTLPILEDETCFEVKSGQTLLLWPGRRHRGHADFSADLRLYWLHFRVVSPKIQAGLFGDTQRLSVPQHVTLSRPAFFESLFRRFLDDRETGRLLPDYAGLLAWLMLYEIADQRPVSKTNRTAAAVANRALTYIRSHLNTPLVVSEIAEELGYNPDYLNRVFFKTYHHTLTQEIHLSRIGYARHLLLYSSMNIAEIAHASGFSDMRYFSRIFKRYEGITATEYRRLNAQVNVNFD